MQNYSLCATHANTMETKLNILSTAGSVAGAQRESLSGSGTKICVLCRLQLQPIIHQMVRIDQIPGLKLEPGVICMLNVQKSIS